jgi:hypothetical protein
MLTTLLSRLRSRPLVHPLRLAAGALLVGCLACGGGGDRAIDRQVFIDTWVDLRIAALQTDSQRLAASDREEILQRHGVTVEDLTRFAETHATDLDFMRDLWNDVELRLDRPAND